VLVAVVDNKMYKGRSFKVISSRINSLKTKNDKKIGKPVLVRSVQESV
jgi:hypothetical protein